MAFFFSSAVRSVFTIGAKTAILCIWTSSFVIPFLPLSWNFFRPAPMEYCYSIIPKAYSSLSSPIGISFASLRSSSEKDMNPSLMMARLGPPRAIRRASSKSA